MLLKLIKFNVYRINIIFLLFMCIFSSSDVLAESNSKRSNLTLALAGDALVSIKLSIHEDPRFLELVDLIRSSDAAFANMEMLFHDYESYPMHEHGGANLRADPKLVGELKWAGFDMLSLANNHTGDYGAAGMLLTKKYINDAGYSASGVGESLREARAPVFFDTPDGRIALISVSSTFPEHSRAGNTRGDIPSHPGLNPLRHTKEYTLNSEQFNFIKNISEKTYPDITSKTLGMDSNGDDRESAWFLGERFFLGKTLSISSVPNDIDMKEIRGAVKSAKLVSDYVIVSLHAHESRGNDKTVPAEFITTFAREMIDSGSDIIVGHGPHVLRGIEVYKNKPIFYSLGNFIYPSLPYPSAYMRTPSELYEELSLDASGYDTSIVSTKISQLLGDGYQKVASEISVNESVVVIPRWENGQLVNINLYPIVIGEGTLHVNSGVPLRADKETSRRIVATLRNLSAPFGTIIRFHEKLGIGKIDF